MENGKENSVDVEKGKGKLKEVDYLTDEINDVEKGKGKEKEVNDFIEEMYNEAKELQGAQSNRSCISVVPKELFNKDTKVFYHPQVISLGPYHFRKEEAKQNVEDLADPEIKGLKSFITVRMHKREDLVDLFHKNEGEDIYKRIKQNYSKYSSCSEVFPFSKRQVAWMMIRDASFLIEVLNRFSNVQNISANVETSASSLLVDNILDRKGCHPLLNEIVKDMLKMENQLPFWVLQDIKPKANTEIEKCWYELALENLSPIVVARVSIEGELKGRRFKEDHILQLLHDYIVDDREIQPEGEREREEQVREGEGEREVEVRVAQVREGEGEGAGRDGEGEGQVLHYLSCLIGLAGAVSHLFIKILSMLLLLLFSPFFIIWLLWHLILSAWHGDYRLVERPQSVSTVEELKRDGLKFKKLEEKGNRHINFEKSNSIFHLPKFRVDDKSEVILRNLIALEICSQEKEKPVIMYVNFMNHLINTSTDVAILRKHDILDNKLGSDEDVAKLWNSFIFSNLNPCYKPIADAENCIINYRKKNLKVLWTQFMRAHFKKPWLFASAMGVVLLLLLIIVQVLCLFVSCQRQNRDKKATHKNAKSEGSW